MSCIITYKGKKYSEEQFKEYFINNKQEFATSIAKNKDVMDSFKRKMEGIDFVFSQSPELASVGSKAQYLQYLSTIFKTSKVKDIVYHGTTEKFDEFDLEKVNKNRRAFWFGIKPEETAFGIKIPVLLNIPKWTDFRGKGAIDVLNNETIDKIKEKGGKGFIGEGFYGETQIGVFEPEQIHVLGGKNDIQGFKEFIGNNKNNRFLSVDSKINSIEKETERLKNTESLYFDENLLTFESKELIKKLKSKTNNLKVEYDNNKQNSFDTETNTININIYEIKALSNISGLSFEETLNITVVHEYTHAAFEYVLKNNPELYNKFKQFHIEFLNHIDNNHFNDVLRNKLGLNDLYQKDFYEFIADAFSNPDVINVLKQMNDGNSFLDKFKQLVFSILKKIGININISAYDKIQDLLNTFGNEDNQILDNQDLFDFTVKERNIANTEDNINIDYEELRNINYNLKNLFNFFLEQNKNKKIKNYEFSKAFGNIKSAFSDYFNNIYSKTEFTEEEEAEFINKEIDLLIENIVLYLSTIKDTYVKFNNLLEKYNTLKNDENKKDEYAKILMEIVDLIHYFDTKSFNNLNLQLILQLSKQSNKIEFKNLSDNLQLSINNINNMQREYKKILKDMSIFESEKYLLTTESINNLNEIENKIKEIEDKLNDPNIEENIKNRLTSQLNKYKEDAKKSNVKQNILSTFTGKGGFKSTTSMLGKITESAYLNSNIAVAAVQGILTGLHLQIKKEIVNTSNLFQTIFNDYLKDFNISLTDTTSQKFMSMEVEEFKIDESGEILLDENGEPVVINTKYFLHEINEKFYKDYNEKRKKIRLLKESLKLATDSEKITILNELTEEYEKLNSFEKKYIESQYESAPSEIFDILNKKVNGISINDVSKDNVNDFLKRKSKFSQLIRKGSNYFYEELINDYYDLKKDEILFKQLLKEKNLYELYEEYKTKIGEYNKNLEKEINISEAESYISNVKKELKKSNQPDEKINKIIKELESMIYVIEIDDEYFEQINYLSTQKNLLLAELEESLIKINNSIKDDSKKLKLSNNKKDKYYEINKILEPYIKENKEVNIEKLTELEKEKIKQLDKENIETSSLIIENLKESEISESNKKQLLEKLSKIKEISKKQAELTDNITTSEYDILFQEAKETNNQKLLDEISYEVIFNGISERKPYSFYKLSIPSNSDYYKFNSVNKKYFSSYKPKENKNYKNDIINFTEQAKKDYRNEKYYNLNTNEKSLLDKIVKLYFEAQKNTRIKNKYRIPSVAKSDIDRILGKEINIDSIKEYFTNSLNKVEDFLGTTEHDFEFHSIPTKYSTLLESDKLSNNYIASVYLFIIASKEEKAYRDNYYKVNAIKKTSKDRIDKDSYEQIENIISTYWFGNKELSQSNVEFLLNRTIDKAAAITAFKSFALNIPGQVVNFLNNKITTFIMNNKDMMSNENWKYGEIQAFKHLKNEFTDEFQAGNISLIGQFAQFMNLKEVRKTNIDSRGINKYNLKLLSFFKNLVESELFYSLLFAYSDKYKININGIDYRFHELYELGETEDILTKIKYQEFRLRKDLNFTEKDLDNIEKIKTQFYKDFTFTYTKINGNFLHLNENQLSRVWYGRALEFMRKYVIPMIVDRFYFNRRYNHYSSGVEEGFYITFIKALFEDIKSFGFNVRMYGSTWNEQEKMAAVKIAKELSIILSMFGLLFLFGYDDDYDPEEDEEFLNFKWWQNHLLYVMLKTQSEISTFTPIIGIREQVNTFTTLSVISGSVKQWVETISLFKDTLLQKDNAYFSYDYNYWKEDQPKIWKYLLKQIGVNGNLYYSDQGIKGFEYAQRLK